MRDLELPIPITIDDVDAGLDDRGGRRTGCIVHGRADRRRRRPHGAALPACNHRGCRRPGVGDREAPGAARRKPGKSRSHTGSTRRRSPSTGSLRTRADIGTPHAVLRVARLRHRQLRARARRHRPPARRRPGRGLLSGRRDGSGDRARASPCGVLERSPLLRPTSWRGCRSAPTRRPPKAFSRDSRTTGNRSWSSAASGCNRRSALSASGCPAPRTSCSWCPPGHPITLAHGDYRLDNLFFDAAGAVTAIDWQIATKGVGGYDFAYFVSQSLAIETRRGADRRTCGDLPGVAARRRLRVSRGPVLARRPPHAAVLPCLPSADDGARPDGPAGGRTGS